jgi:hypothetical protein
MAAENGAPPEGKKATDPNGKEPKPGATIDQEAETPPQSSQTPSDTDGAPVESDSAAATETAPDDTATTDAMPSETSPAEPGQEEAVTTSEPAPVAPPPASGAEHLRGVTPLVIAGLVGGVVALGIGFGLQAAAVLPAPGLSEAQAALAEAGKVNDAVTGLDQRITSLEAASSQAIADRALLDDLSKKVDSIDAFSKALGDRLLNAETAIAALKDDTTGPGGVNTKQMLSSLSKRVMRLETQPPPAAPDNGTDAKIQQEIDSLSKRVMRLETMPQPSATAPASSTTEKTPPVSATTAAPTDVASPAAPAPASAAPVASSDAASAPTADDQAASAAALEALRRAAMAGGSFSDALQGLGNLGPPAAIAALGPLAEKGAPSRAELISDFPKVADAIMAADSDAGEDASFFGQVAAFGRSLVKVRPVDGAAEDPTATVVAKMRTALASGDLQTALAARDGLPASGLTASQSWADAVSDRLAIDKLVTEIAPIDTASGNG